MTRAQAPRATADRDLAIIIQRLIARFDPDRIMLFGSRARGDARADSDFDLLVVLPKAPKPREARIAMLRELRDLRAAVDILLTTRADIERRGSIPSIPLHSALAEGIEVYARA